MKKALLLALVGWFAAVAPALAYPPPPANANFASERGVPFGLVLDGRPLTRGLARQVHVDQLAPGMHWADFTLPAAYGRVVRFRRQVWLQPGLETSFVLIARPGRPLDLRQVNAVALYGPGYGGSGYGNGYNGSGHYNSPTPYCQGNSYPDNNSQYNGGYTNAPDGYGNDDNGPDNDGYNSAPNNGNGGYNNAPNNGGYNNAPANGNNGGYYPGSATSSYRALAPQDVSALVQTMQQRITEVSKLNAAKDGLKQRSIQAYDLERLVRSLNSEACRVDLAKFAYEHVTDPQNFSRVYDAFETESGAQAVEQATRAAAPR